MIKKRQQQKRTDMLGSLLFGVTNKTTSMKMTKLKKYFGTEGIRRLEGYKTRTVISVDRPLCYVKKVHLR